MPRLPARLSAHLSPRTFAGLALAVTSAIVLALLGPPAGAQAASVTAAFTRTSDWGSGYEGKYTITNGTSTAVSGWRVEADMPAGTSIGTYWDALLTMSGGHAVFTNRDYNATIAPGSSVSFGFVASGAGSPTGCTINGSPCGGGDPGTPGAPGTPAISGRSDTSLTLTWSAAGGTVTGYRVYEGTAVRATVSGTSATIGGLEACSTHTYTVRAYAPAGESPASGPVTGTTTGCTSPGAGRQAAPYLYLGWGDAPAPATVMNATGIKWFTMAFVLSGGGCAPAWDGSRPLQGGVDAQAIAQIRAAGGDIVPSIGGWSGNKLGPACPTSEALAGAYQQLIDAYGLTAVDVDIENSDEFENEAVQDRILGALKIVKRNNPEVQTIVTFGTTTTGPNWWGTRLINRAAELQAGIDVFTIMPFDFGGGADMYQNTVNAAEGLKATLKNAFGWPDATAYAHMGLSGMNGLSDQQETTTPGTWTRIRDWAESRGLARLAFWSVNRDRSCPGGGVVSHCSGISQGQWEFTAITAGFRS